MEEARCAQVSPGSASLEGCHRPALRQDEEVEDGEQEEDHDAASSNEPAGSHVNDCCERPGYEPEKMALNIICKTSS